MQLLNQPKVLIFITVSLALIWLSRRSLLNLRSHDFYRFFAWEAILGLILINADRWFADWLSHRQVISWLLLAVSAFMVTHGTVSLYRFGQPDSRRVEPTLIGIERTTELVTTGIYRYIRRPLYGAALVGVWGVALKEITAISVSLALVSTIRLIITARVEETENLRFFGDEYRLYMGKTHMFIPFIF